MKSAFKTAVALALGLSAFASCKKPAPVDPVDPIDPVDPVVLTFVKDGAVVTSDSYDLASDLIYVAPELKGAPAGATVTYSSDKETVATVDAQGKVTPLSVGTTTITAAISADVKASYTLTVSDSTPVIVQQERNLEFTDASVEKTLGDPAFTNILKGATSGVAYASDNTAVATVDATSGLVTLVGIGDARITASAPETAEYKAGTASFSLKVKQMEYNGVGIDDITDGGTIDFN